MCFAHVLKLVVKTSLAQTPELEDIRSRWRRIVGHFKSSTTAKEKLSEMQRHINSGGDYCLAINVTFVVVTVIVIFFSP